MSTHDNFFNLLFSPPLIQFFLKQPACIYHLISFFKKVYVRVVSTLLFIIHTTICLLSLQAIDTLRSLMTPYQTQWLFELMPFSSFLFKTPSTLGWGTSLGVLLPLSHHFPISLVLFPCLPLICKMVNVLFSQISTPLLLLVQLSCSLSRPYAIPSPGTSPDWSEPIKIFSL